MTNKKEEFTLDNLLGLIFIAPIIYGLSYIMNSEKFSLSTGNVDNFSNYIKFDNKFLLVYLIAGIIWLINAIYKKANNFIFMITIYILIVTIGYFFIPNGFHFKDTLILKAPGLIIFSFVFSLIIGGKYTNFINKNKYKKGDNFKITQKEDEIFCKTENGEFGPYLDFYSKIKLENSTQNNIKFSFLSSFNNNTQIFLNDETIGIGIGKRINLSGEEQRFIDILNLKIKEKTRIYIDEVSIIYNAKFENRNTIVINYKKNGVWKTTQIDTNTLVIMGEINEQLSSYFYLVYNNTRNIYYKLEHTNYGYLNKELDKKLDEYNLVFKGDIYVLFETKNKDLENEIDVINYENKALIEKSQIKEKIGNLGIKYELKTNHSYKIFVFDDEKFENNYNFITRARNFLDGINKKLIFEKQEELRLEEIKRKEELRKDVEATNLPRLFTIIFILLVIIVIIMTNA